MRKVRRNTHPEIVLEYIRSHGSISPVEAAKECDIFNLDPIVKKLKDQHYPIVAKPTRYTDRFGEYRRCQRYSLDLFTETRLTDKQKAFLSFLYENGVSEIGVDTFRKPYAKDRYGNYVDMDYAVQMVFKGNIGTVNLDKVFRPAD